MATRKYLDASGIIKKYDLAHPFIHKGLHAYVYPSDFVQMLWPRWGGYGGFDYKLHISAFHNEYWDIYYLPKVFQELREHYFNRIKNEKSFLNKHFSDWKASCRKLDKRISAYEAAIADKKFSKVLKTYKDFVEEYVHEYMLSVPPQESCGFQPEQWINPEIEAYSKKYKLDYNETAALLASPMVHSFIMLEEIELIKLTLQKEKLGKEEFAIGLKKHQMRWYWIKNNYAYIEELPVSFFEERITTYGLKPKNELIDHLESLMRIPQIVKLKKKKLFSKCTPDKKLRLYVKITEIFAEMQDARKAYVLKANWYHKLFLQEVVKNFDIKLEELWFYTYEELLSCLKTRKFLMGNEISERKKMVVTVESSEEKIVLTGDEAIRLYNFLQEKIGSASELKGIVAQTGKITGAAKIVLRVKDIEKVMPGDILVASMTRPEMTVAMNKAAGFVTDEGGITCHAAIVAREQKKPCVIGTKNATKIFSDGDMIELDADKGIVRKI